MKHTRIVFQFTLIVSTLVSSLLIAQTGSPASSSENTADSIAVRALKASPNEGSIYEISFITRDTLASDAAILLEFPPECDLSGLEIVGSSSIDGGWTLEKNRRVVTLRRTGLGKAVAPGNRVSVKLGLVKNPADFSAAHRVEVEVRASARQQAGVKKQVEIAFK